MTPFRIALANAAIPADREHAVLLVEQAIGEAAAQDADLVCFPEAFVPGYRVAAGAPPIDPTYLELAWTRISAGAAKAGIAVILGTERLDAGRRLLTALVIDRDGTRLGFQDKVQLDPSEDATYSPGTERRIFRTGALTFGIVICHEGWRYPETVRWAARHGAQVVFHPHYDEDKPARFPDSYADPANSFHEKAVLCRAAENTCYFATVNCAAAGASTTSAVARPDGTLLAWQPYGVAGVLIADLDLDTATRKLAQRYRPTGA